MNKIKIAIVDCIGLNYDGTTLTKKGIGGSESSIISIAKELVKLDFSVTIFNDCDTAETRPGNYDGVEYLPMRALLDRDYGFDIVISQRTVIPFAPLEMYDQVRQPPPRDYDPRCFVQLQKPSQLKILWMQDTFIWGDSVLEYLVVNNYIDEIFNLSDWHISYTTNSSHGPKRQFEVLKNKIYHTRNAINRWIDWVDIKQKDPNLFVYNASITKGMVPLVTKIWPKLKQRLPNARLKIIGGYYAFKNEPTSPAEKQWFDLQRSVAHDNTIEFTGIITQPEIAAIMAKATYNLFPGAYPETSGISTIESINYNTPIIGTRFGAMEESGTDSASYFIDYAIEPNSLFTWIDSDRQVEKYVNLVLSVVNNPYLHQQKQYACNAVKDISTWDTVALQWKQHFYYKLNKTLTDEEQKKVDWINYRVRKVFKKRFINPEEIRSVDKPKSVYSLPCDNAVKIAFIDIVGMSYDGATLDRKGLGGSESAVVLVSRELAKIGFNVTVYNACDEEDSSPGIYENVTYKPLKELGDNIYDVVISSRVVTPFITRNWYEYPQTTNRKIEYSKFEKIRSAAKLKVFWMHDTFCWGDDILEDLVVAGAIDEIWTLSDFHSNYVMNCSHPRLRNYEVLRNHVWNTRNGLTKYFDSVDIFSKDPDLFIFNANMSKGLSPLLNNVWPRVKQKIPSAKLIVIGGHYKLGAAFAHGDEETEFLKLVGPHLNEPSIHFTGIISQKQVAEICAKASFFIYPTAFPETYSISALEAMYANTLVLTCRFGALEETASPSGYMINYSATPNSVYPNVDADAQATKFVEMVYSAWNNVDKKINLMRALEDIKDIAGWDTVALEWKQHLYYKLGYYLSKNESQLASYSKKKYQILFNRRLSTEEEWLAPRLYNESAIKIISPFYNAEHYIERCIASVASQDYENYLHILIDDASTDRGFIKAKNYIESLPESIKNKFLLIKREENCGAVYNHISCIRTYTQDNDIVMLLDGDDSLVNRPDVFTYYNHIHQQYNFTYGSCWSMVDNIPLVAQPYPPEVRSTKSYRSYRFNWNMPYTHLRTLKSKLLKYEPDSVFQNDKGVWYKAGGDNSTFYAALYNCDTDKIYAVPDIVYNYNDINPLNDYKVNRHEQDNAINMIINSNQQNSKVKQKKRILIAIPTNKNIEPDTFKSIYDLEVSDDYELDFQYFYGYQIDQIRNLIAHWVTQYGYDYLFSVDSDISFTKDTLAKLLAHDKDIVSGIYIQRIPGTHTIEIMRKNDTGGVSHVNYKDIEGKGLVPIDSCGFGCVLIKKSVFDAIPYPHFVYKSALDHAFTLSEDVYFCQQARDKGFTLWADTSILCDHIGSCVYKVNPHFEQEKTYTPLEKRLRNLRTSVSMPIKHGEYLHHMKNNLGVDPQVIYDIGASVLHWTDVARKVWPLAHYHAFEAMDECGFLYQESGISFAMGVLSDQDGKVVDFFLNTEAPAGNSYYRENVEFSPAAAFLFTDNHKVKKTTYTLDTVIKTCNFPLPDLIKMDVQGAEMDILKGATYALTKCKNLILEIHHVEYNKGAPGKQEVIAFVESLGFELVAENFASSVGLDGDYHFTRKR